MSSAGGAITGPPMAFSDLGLCVVPKPVVAKTPPAPVIVPKTVEKKDNQVIATKNVMKLIQPILKNPFQMMRSVHCAM